MLKETSNNPKSLSSPSKEEGDFNTAVDLLEETMEISHGGEVDTLIERVKDGIVIMRHILRDLIKRPELQLRTLTLELLLKQLLVAIDSVAELDKLKVAQEREKMKCEMEKADAEHKQEIDELTKQLESAQAQSKAQIWVLKNSLKGLKEQKVLSQSTIG